jgi:hypothetical protein
MPIARCHLAKVGHRSGKPPQLVLLLLHSCKKVFILLLEDGLLVLSIISQDVSRLVEPVIHLLDG